MWFFRWNRVNHLCITCERQKYTCVLPVFTLKPYDTHILKNNQHVCLAEFTGNERYTLQCITYMRITEFTCEYPKCTSMWLNLCVFHRWPCGFYIEPHVDDNLNTYNHVIKWTHVWTFRTEYYMWTSNENICLVWKRTCSCERVVSHVITGNWKLLSKLF